MNQDERIFPIVLQTIDLKEFNHKGKVLDIGGGGEGVIGQALGEKVVAIDPRSDELEEAPEGPLKIIMDARELKFLNNTFDLITSFFTMMYIDSQDHLKVFEEIYRVLSEEGKFIIWDVIVPKYPGGIKDLFLVPLEICLRDKKVNTTYGIRWQETRLDMEYYMELGRKVGFIVTTKEEMNQVYCIKFSKLNNVKNILCHSL